MKKNLIGQEARVIRNHEYSLDGVRHHFQIGKL